LPLRSLDDVGSLVFADGEVTGWKVWNDSLERQITQTATLLYPVEEDAWRVFCTALREGRITVRGVMGNYPNRTPTLRELDYRPDGEDFEAVSRLARRWFGKLQSLTPLFREAAERKNGGSRTSSGRRPSGVRF